MQEQYFGDVNDYHKFGLLRILSKGFRTGICWMRTPPDKATLGQRAPYLTKPEKWRRYDPELFEFFREHVYRKKERRLELMEESGLLKATKYFSEPLTDEGPEREQYFQRMLTEFEDRELVFFDPDIGLDVPSVPFGRKYSSKYLYLAEVVEAYRAGMSVLFFQNVVPQTRDRVVADCVARLKEAMQPRVVLTYQTSNVTFFLIPQRRNASHFQDQDREIGETWGGEITVIKPRASRTFNAPSFGRGKNSRS